MCESNKRIALNVDNDFIKNYGMTYSTNELRKLEPVKRLILKNFDGSEAIIPMEYLPEGLNDGREDIDLIDATRHLVSTINGLQKQRNYMADLLELVCSRLAEDGDCPLFYCCPARKYGKSCGNLTDEDWIEWSKNV